MEFQILDYRRSRSFEEKPGQREIAWEGDFEIGFAVKNREGMNTIGDERGDFIGGAGVMGFHRGEEEVVAGGLWGFHGKEIGAGNRFHERSGGIGTMQRIGDRMGGRGSAVDFCRSKDFFDE